MQLHPLPGSLTANWGKKAKTWFCLFRSIYKKEGLPFALVPCWKPADERAVLLYRIRKGRPLRRREGRLACRSLRCAPCAARRSFYILYIIKRKGPRVRSPAQLEEKGRVYARCAVLAKRREMAAKERPAYGGALCAFVRVRSDLVLALVVGDDRAPHGEGVIRFGDVQVVHRVVRRRAAPILVALLAVGDGKSLKVHLAGALVKVV